MRRFWIAAASVLKFAAVSFLVLFVLGYSGRISLILYVIPTLALSAFYWRHFTKWIGLAWVVGLALALTPLHVTFDSQFPDGVWVRSIVAGLLSGPVPREDGVPRFWWTGSCIVGMNDPTWMIVIGTGGSREAMAEAYTYEMEDSDTRRVVYEALMDGVASGTRGESYEMVELYADAWNGPDECVSLEADGRMGSFSIRGSHCESPNVFEVTWGTSDPEDGMIRPVE